ncbi:unnamed protein product [Vitrella brassicaformis CCMP3155]|uniref:Uncharacterized protein n=2 Tax=Vitrella brassicaformis TaxID=1169539 RepID=A0A0G4GV24_VITBC|nr:unnamed protein product [Vitrella brassicaformis CCMP3155]|eukprot:CEM34476.1 unnamed protein product [Vitrella brassicaformis CCMP3155]
MQILLAFVALSSLICFTHSFQPSPPLSHLAFRAPVSAAAPSRHHAPRSRLSSSLQMQAPATLIQYHGVKLRLPVFGDTSVGVAFTPEACKELSAKVDEVLQTFRVIADRREGRERPRREPSMEFQTEVDGTRISFECNPNIFPDYTKAQVFFQVKSPHVDITAQLSFQSLIEALAQYKEQYGM